MKFGVVFPQTEIGTEATVIRDYAQTAEGLGYDYLLAYDHVLGANPNRPGGWDGPYTHEDIFQESFVLFSYLAGITKQIEFTTGIIILPQRQTALVAKQAAALDVLSGGRLRLGVGTGWNKVEYEALNENFETRGKRQAEQVEVLRLLWTQRLVTYRGQYHTISDAGLHPLPIQQPIPIWFGGAAGPVLRRMAKLGDGWICFSYPPEKLTEYTNTIHGYMEAEGRDPAQFGLDYPILLKDKDDKTLAQEIETLSKLGVTHIRLNTMKLGFSPQDHIEAIKRFSKIVSNP
jgi:probable F420-dependent oxidoreductase